jgi:hypothetical protein
MNTKVHHTKRNAVKSDGVSYRVMVPNPFGALFHFTDAQSNP